MGPTHIKDQMQNVMLGWLAHMKRRPTDASLRLMRRYERTKILDYKSERKAKES